MDTIEAKWKYALAAAAGAAGAALASGWGGAALLAVGTWHA